MDNSTMAVPLNITPGDVERLYPHPAQQAVMWILPILMILLNIPVFIVAPRMNAINPCTAYGMLSMAVADFGLGVANILRTSYNTYTHYELQTGHPICVIDGYLTCIFAAVSVVTITFMNIDRLLTMAFPLHYPMYLTKKKVIHIHMAIWLGLIILFAPTTTGILGTSIKYYPTTFICVVDWAGNLTFSIAILILVQVIPFTVIAICFTGIFYFARKKADHMGGGSGRGGSQVQVHRGGNRSDNDNSQWKKDMRIFKTLVIMTLGYFLAWLPYGTTVAIPQVITGHSLHPLTDFIAPWLAASNSFWNPIIYLPTMKPFYEATMQLVKTLPCIKGSQP